MEEASARWMADKKKKNNQNKLGGKQQQQLKRQHDHKRQHSSLMHGAVGKQNKTNGHVTRDLTRRWGKSPECLILQPLTAAVVWVKVR